MSGKPSPVNDILVTKQVPPQERIEWSFQRDIALKR